jgi:hypothetical protein
MKNTRELVSTAAWLALCLAAGGCSEGVAASQPTAAVAVETETTPARSGEWALAEGSALALSGSGALEIRGEADSIRVADTAVELPSVSADAARFVYAYRPGPGPETAIGAVELRDGAWTAPRMLTSRGSPDRVAISKDGRNVAFVAGADGLVALWVVPFDGGAPVQLTNLGLRSDRTGLPAGFVPVPHRSPPRFEGRELVWTAPDGEHRVALP